jgi:hypothetical protein
MMLKPLATVRKLRPAAQAEAQRWPSRRGCLNPSAPWGYVALMKQLLSSSSE